MPPPLPSRIPPIIQRLASRSPGFKPLAIPPVLPPSQRNWRYLKPHDLAGLKNLLFASRIIVEGAYAGRHRSPYKGSSPEFVDYREYNPGDSIRTIDWKAYARTDRYFVKLFQKETDLNCYLLVDRSASMDYGGPRYRQLLPGNTVSKLDYAFQLAAALAYLMVKQGDKVGLGLFDEKLGPCHPPGGTFAHLYQLLATLERQKPGRRTSVARVLREAHGFCKRRGLLVVISDLLDEPAELFAALEYYRHRRHEIILFHVLHEFEQQLPPFESVRFIDAENGEQLQTRPADIRLEYEEQLGAFINNLRTTAQARGIDYQLVNTAMPYVEVLKKYLLRRNNG